MSDPRHFDYPDNRDSRIAPPDAEAVAYMSLTTYLRQETAALDSLARYREAVERRVRAECAAKVNEAEPCDWHQDGMGLWQTDCGNAFEFNEDGPWMNGMKFCGYCGKKLVEVPYEPMPDDDDDEAQP